MTTQQTQPTVGFILLTHNLPEQAIRLVNTLNRMFENPPIVCHHDFSKCDFPRDQLPNNVSFVEPSIETAWGRFSLVQAKLNALAELYARDDAPDWYYFISGADYPVKPAEQILVDLNQSSADVHIRFKPIRFGEFDKPWKKAYYKRYCGLNLLATMKNGTGRKVVRQLNLGYHPWLTRLFTPFKRGFDCYAGEQWYTGNRKAAEKILNFCKSRPDVVKHFRRTKIPDEAFYQSVFCNMHDLKKDMDNLRYVDWSEKKPHPKSLDESDWSLIQSSGAHFARKLDYKENDPLIEIIDQAIL